MKKFLLKSLVFIALILAFFVAEECTVRHIPNDYSFKHNYLQSHADEIEILCLGPSFEHYGINPALFHRNAFNAAIPGQSVEVDHLFAARVLDSCRSLKVLILPLDLFSIHHTQLNISYYRYEYHHQYQLDVSNLSHRDRIAYFAYTPRKSCLMAIYKWINPRYERIISDSLGWKCDQESFTKLPLEQQQSAIDIMVNDFFFNKKQENSSNTYSLYASTIQHCLREKVHVILLTSPQHEALVNRLNPYDIDYLLSVGASFERQYSNVTYVNLLRPCTFADSLFCDADHLNAQGAEVLTLILDSIIENHLLLCANPHASL